MPKRFFVSAVALILLLAAVPLFAQYGQSTGGIQGRVTDEQGGVLPGVAVTIKGPGAPKTLYSDSRGEFRATNLDPGRYTLTLALEGFSTVNRENVDVSLGRNTELTIPMQLSSVAATITVSGAPPLLETKRVSTGQSVTQEELKSIPTARDPWVVLQTVPGVQVDRINVAGSESGQQSNFSSKGSNAGTFTVDGVNLTDMSALGASAGYYDFDSFQEMQIITGGSDASISGSGTHLNMITKRGTNEVHGSGRLFIVDGRHFQSKNLPGEAKTQVDSNGNPARLSSGNHIDAIQDMGVEAGGPVVKDRLWLWGAYGRNQINLLTAGGRTDNTTLEDFNAKMNLQIVESNAANVWYLRSDKLKQGRSGGLTRPQETTWNQTTPQNTWKVEDSQVFSSQVFASVQYNGANGDFTLTPQGGDKPIFYDAEGIWHNSYVFFGAPRPQRQAKGDISFFFTTGTLGHELKAGFGYLKAGSRSHSAWPSFGEFSTPDGPVAAATYSDLADCDVPCAVVTRNSNLSTDNKYYSGYLQDTLSFDRLSINLGVRWDRQSGENLPTNIPANPTYPTLLPAISYPGQGKQFTWEDWQPRAGITYALGTNRSTVFKASYARYADALGTGTVDNTNPTAAVAYGYYAWNDTNGDNLAQISEIDLNAFQFSRNYDPADPGALASPDTFARGFHSPLTDEFIVGVDHELLPSFAVGVNYTYRKFKDQIFRSRTGLTRADYVLDETITGTLPDGTPFSQDVFASTAPIPPGYVYDNRSGYDQFYSGVDFTFNKRLSNRWLARGSFTYGINKQNVGSAGCVDPTNVLPGQSLNTGDPQTGYTAQSCKDGEFVGVRSTGSGSKDSVFLSNKWQFYVNGMYQLPLGFNVAASVFGREGYPIDWFRRRIGSDGELRDVAVSNLDDQRYKNVFEFDARVEKVVGITATSNLTLSVDLFNVTNENTVLQRFNRLNRTNTGLIKEIQSPRIFRFGARFAF